jgi:hypothetical protein
MLLNRFRLANNEIDECVASIDARALEVKDVLVKANGIVHEFLVQYHDERLIPSEEESNPALSHGVGNEPSRTRTLRSGRSSPVVILPVPVHKREERI